MYVVVWHLIADPCHAVAGQCVQFALVGFGELADDLGGEVGDAGDRRFVAIEEARDRLKVVPGQR